MERIVTKSTNPKACLYLNILISQITKTTMMIGKTLEIKAVSLALENRTEKTAMKITYKLIRISK